MFGVVPNIWNKLNPADENKMCTWALRCLLIEDGNRLILIDNGSATNRTQNFQPLLFARKRHARRIIGSTRVQPERHHRCHTPYHFDHWAEVSCREGDKLVLAFKQATYWSNQRHWKWATSRMTAKKRHSSKKTSFRYRKAVNLFTRKPEPKVSRPACPSGRFFGHTDAMMLPQFNYKGKRSCIWSTVLPSRHISSKALRDGIRHVPTDDFA